MGVRRRRGYHGSGRRRGRSKWTDPKRLQWRGLGARSVW